jgi:hypothetical protein
MGEDWAAMIPFFNGRSDTDIRNRWNMRLRLEIVDDGTKITDTGSEGSCAEPNGKETELSDLEEEQGTEASEALVLSEVVPEQKVGRVRRQFTPAEDAIILQAMEENPSERWSVVAKRLEGCTTRQCRNRWFHRLAPAVRPRRWTPEEDRLLVEKINEIGKDWAKMKQVFRGRKIPDIKNRWRRYLEHETLHDGTKFIYTERDSKCADPQRKRDESRRISGKEAALSVLEEDQGPRDPSSFLVSRRPKQKGSGRRRPFTPAEDAIITKAMLSDPPPSWDDIAKELKESTADQCWRRWFHYLAAQIRPDHWTSEEDRLLIEKVNEMGKNWKVIRRSFDGRSIIDIRNRWNRHLKFETENDGTRFISAGSDPKCPDPRRKECNQCKPAQQDATLSIPQKEVHPAAFEGLAMNSRGAPLSWPSAPLVLQSDTATTEESTDEVFLLNPREMEDTLERMKCESEPLRDYNDLTDQL